MRLQVTMLVSVLAYSCLPDQLTTFGKKIVTHLPGFDGRLPFELETGYVSVGEAEDVHLFYYFAKSERNPETDPLLLWFVGGFACSGLSAFIYDVGPLGFDLERFELGKFPQLIYRENSWTRVSSIIFVDAPAGAGYSYSEGPEINEWRDSKFANNLHAFIKKWLLDHPEFSSNPLYLSGNSYGGKMVTIVAREIMNGNSAGEKPLINLKGYLLGNSATGENHYEKGYQVPSAHGLGLISDELYEVTKSTCKGDYLTPCSTQCALYLEEVKEILKGINDQHILEPKCDVSLLYHEFPEHRTMLELTLSSSNSRKILIKKCRDYGYLASESWANDDEVKEALGVVKGWRGKWFRCRTEVSEKYSRDIPSVVSYNVNLTRQGLRALVYSGDHDLLANVVMAQAWLRALNFSVVDKWRPWWVDGQVAGFTKTFANNLTYATVKGAGHSSPEYKPLECRSMFERWISGEVL